MKTRITARARSAATGRPLIALLAALLGGGPAEAQVEVEVAGDLVVPEVLSESSIADAEGEPQRASVVADLTSGRTAVVWEALDASGKGVRVLPFDPEGFPRAAPLEAAVDPSGNQTSPRAVWTLGRLGVVWSDDGPGVAVSAAGLARGLAGGGGSIVSRGFDPQSGAATEEVDVSGRESRVPTDPTIAAGRSGETIVGWKGGDGAPRLSFVDLPSLEVDEEGGTIDIPFEVDLGALVLRQEIAAAATGDFLVVSERIGGLFAQAFRADGSPKGEAIQIASGFELGGAKVAMNAAGEALVVWHALGEDFEDREVFGRWLDLDGRPLGPVRRLNQETAGDQRSPAVASNSVGDFAVVWETGPFFWEPLGPPRGRREPARSAARSAGEGAEATSIVARFFDPRGRARSDDVEIADSDEAGAPVEPQIAIDDADRVSVVFGRRRDERSQGVFRRGVRVALAAGSCSVSDAAQCLLGGRFRVDVQWRDFAGNSGAAKAVALTGDTGYFWFFDRANVEVVVKVLDACALSDRFWVFAGGLTNVEVAITVDDTVSGLSRTYYSPSGTAFQPVQDTDAFASCSSPAPAGRFRPEAAVGSSLADVVGGAGRDAGGARPWMPAGARRTPSESGPDVRSRRRGKVCGPDSRTLCLVGDRFAVDVSWRSGGRSGVGRPVELTADTGYFWFFGEDNVELVVKVLDACAFSNRFWVFAGGLTDVETEITIIDLESGDRRTYRNQQGVAFAPVQDTDAFSTCRPS